MTVAKIGGGWAGALLLLLCVAVPEAAQAARKGAGYNAKLIPGKGFFTSTWRGREDRPTLIRNARILTGSGDDLERTDMLISGGIIQRIGSGLAVPADARVIEATDKWITPGLIDLGFSFVPGADERTDGIEWSLPSLGQYRAEQVRALAGGITTVLYNRFPPADTSGKAAATAGFSLGVVLRNMPDRDLQGTLFPDVDPVMTLRCPADATGWKQLRALWRRANAYIDRGSEEINEDLNLLAAVQKGDLPLHIRCGKAEALSLALAFAQDNKITYRAVTAASEAYRLADRLAKRRICAAFFVGQQDFSPTEGHTNVLAAPLMDAVAGRSGCAAVQAGGTEDIGQLHLLAGRARAQAEALGLQVPPAHAIAWITANPAKVLGISDRVGSIGPGRVADLVVWSGNPFSAYSRAEKVFLDGALVWDLQGGGRLFELDGDIRAQLLPGTPATPRLGEQLSVGGFDTPAASQFGEQQSVGGFDSGGGLPQDDNAQQLPAEEER